MSKKLVIALVVIALVVLAAGAYFFLKKEPASQTPTTTVAETTPTAEKKSLLDLFKSGGSQTCQITQERSTGTVKTSNDKSRMDMATTVADKTITTHIIVNADYIYMWNDDSKTGYKMKTDTIQSAATPSATQNNVDLNQQVQVKCESWTVDPSVFILPTDIQFSDLSTMMKKVEGVSLDKSVCDKITDAAAKASCLSAFK